MKFKVGDRVLAKPHGSSQWEFAKIIGFTDRHLGKRAASGKIRGIMYFVDIENYGLDDAPRWEHELKPLIEAKF